MSHCANLKLGEYNTDFHLCLRESASDGWCKNTGQWLFLTIFKHCALVAASLWGIDSQQLQFRKYSYAWRHASFVRLHPPQIPTTYTGRPASGDQYFAAFEKIEKLNLWSILGYDSSTLDSSLTVTLRQESKSSLTSGLTHSPLLHTDAYGVWKLNLKINEDLSAEVGFLRDRFPRLMLACFYLCWSQWIIVRIR